MCLYIIRKRGKEFFVGITFEPLLERSRKEKEKYFQLRKKEKKERKNENTLSFLKRKNDYLYDVVDMKGKDERRGKKIKNECEKEKRKEKIKIK